MKNGVFAIYKGIEYKASKRGQQLVLISNNEEDLRNGFEFDDFSKQYVKTVDRNDVEKFFKRIVNCEYKGDTFLIADENEDSLMLISGPRSYLLKDLGFQERDRGEFIKWAPKNEVTNLCEKIINRK